MKVVLVFLLAVIAVAVASPTAVKQLGFRNLYVKPTGAVSRPGPKIIGGTEAEPHSVPAQAFLTISDILFGWYCGGSLITPRTVLTAGHCGDGGLYAEVVLGAHRPLSNENTQVVAISFQLRVHEGYNADEISNDISLVLLSDAVVLTVNIQLIPLPTSAANLYAGETGRISGWGLTNGAGTTISSVLNIVDVVITTNAVCEEAFGIYVRETNICTSGDEGTGACNGDSGGPLSVNGTQVGIVSFGAEGCPAGAPSVFTRVTGYLDWIAANSA